ncbi:MAG: hypothetical protein DI640_11530 [Sphingomonas taxi]|uniref:HipA N-terminal subdomain 1 domain-containing protein n=1 Tax=Sphingomonas taxi TaxID=1549858 RepID=A0A2W5AQK3_9SPHN|nr:MAG: hypothetical protein DI640_11530 [Sphingomonas taxi]
MVNLSLDIPDRGAGVDVEPLWFGASTDRALVVRWDQHLVGLLTQDRSGDLSFGYDPAWVSGDDKPLSRSLPLRHEPFNRAACRSFFGRLLPEGDQRQGAAAALDVSAPPDIETDDFNSLRWWSRGESNP